MKGEEWKWENERREEAVRTEILRNPQIHQYMYLCEFYHVWNEDVPSYKHEDFTDSAGCMWKCDPALLGKILPLLVGQNFTVTAYAQDAQNKLSLFGSYRSTSSTLGRSCPAFYFWKISRHLKLIIYILLSQQPLQTWTWPQKEKFASQNKQTKPPGYHRCQKGFYCELTLNIRTGISRFEVFRFLHAQFRYA